MLQTACSLCPCAPVPGVQPLAGPVAERGDPILIIALPGPEADRRTFWEELRRVHLSEAVTRPHTVPLIEYRVRVPTLFLVLPPFDELFNIRIAHEHLTTVITRSTLGHPVFLRALVSESAGLVVVVPDHFSTLASCLRPHGMRKAPIVLGCLRLGLSAHVKMKNRLHSAKGATCSS